MYNYLTSYIKSIILALILIFLLSKLARIAYIYTLCGIASWIAIGHLITIDDDMPREWSNPSSDKSLWYASLKILIAKILVLIILICVVFFYPETTKLGA
ncbi:MAG: hypothetical protein AAGB12_16605 [Pseudomonadota bacterium]